MRHPLPAPRAALLGALACAALAACAGDGGTTTASAWRTVTDTVGDTVVVRTLGASDSAAALRLVEELRIGEFEGADEYQFASVGFVLPAPGNGVYVWDRTLTSLRQYDSAGAFVRRIGGKGGGPGEYGAANGIVLLRDGRLVLWDPRNTRMTVYDSAGAAVGSWRFASNLFVGGFGGLLADTADNVYAMNWFRLADTTREALPGERSGYLVLGPDGAVRDSVLPPRLDAPAASIVASSNGGTSMSNVPFAPQRAWTVSPFGYVVSGVGDRYAITLHRPGAPLRIERDVAAVPVDPDEKANAEEIAIAQMRQTDPSWRWNGPPIPDTKPLFGAIRVAADGRIWVQRALAGVRVEPEEPSLQGSRVAPAGEGPRERIPPRRWRDPVVFDVYEPDGRLVGTLAVPERAQVIHMRGDHAWGVERDEVDVPYVLRWRIEPAPASRAARPE
jgi:hypothetical protein